MGRTVPVPEVQARLADFIEDELLPTMKNAVDSLNHWGEYVDPYYKHKWAFDADVAQIRSVIARTEAVLAGRDGLGEYD